MTLHVFDPEGDILFTVYQSPDPFAEWNKVQPPFKPIGPGKGNDSPDAHPENKLPESGPAEPKFRGKFQAEQTLNIDIGFLDPDAFLWLMAAVHCRSSKLPTRLSLEQLARVAVVIDYYDCVEAMAVYVRVWFSQLVTPSFTTPSTYSRNLMLWIFVFSIFNRESQLLAAVKVAAETSTEPVRTVGLPISDIVVDLINNSRKHMIEKIVGFFNKEYEALSVDFTPQCSLDCDSKRLRLCRST
ncbi:hypothetical protein VTO42DRAFT_475 [Malbranchea cinnamomea]